MSSGTNVVYNAAPDSKEGDNLPVLRCRSTEQRDADDRVRGFHEIPKFPNRLVAKALAYQSPSETEVSLKRITAAEFRMSSPGSKFWRLYCPCLWVSSRRQLGAL